MASSKIGHRAWPTAFATLAGIVLSAAGLGSTPRPMDSVTGSRQALSLLEAARRAIDPTGTIHALVLKGTIAEGLDGATGQAGVLSGPVEYRLLRPDHFLRIKEWDIGRDKRVRRDGFRGGVFFSSDGGSTSEKTPVPLVLPLLYAKLALGCAGWTDGPLALKVSILPGQPDTLRFESAEDGVWFLEDLAPDTHLPLRLRYTSTVALPGPPLSPQDRRRGLSALLPPKPVEVSLTFEDRRIVQSVSVPFRIREIAGGVTLEDRRFEAIAVNPKLGENDFK